MQTCADCGATVEWVSLSMGGWGHPIENPPIGDRAWDMFCRVVRDRGRMTGGDYHYVEGEEQRHFVEKVHEAPRVEDVEW